MRGDGEVYSLRPAPLGYYHRLDPLPRALGSTVQPQPARFGAIDLRRYALQPRDMWRRGLLVLLLLTSSACAFLLPASWRAFRIEADDAPPAITRALDTQALEIEDWDQAKAEMSTGWQNVNDGVEQSRERFVISWAHNDNDDTLTVYVRHEAQDREVGTQWSSAYHDRDKELVLLELITEEIERQIAE